MCDERRYISDIVGDDYKSWTNERIVFDAGTGTGKTTFCLDVLGRYAEECGKKILYLCNRHELKKQTYENVKKLKLTDCIKVRTYQSLQNGMIHFEEIPHYDYVIADEVHYFTADADFNDYTVQAYDYVMTLTDCVVILMSATATALFQQLEEQGALVYKIPNTYDYVRELQFYKGRQLEIIINDILKNEPEAKAIVFLNSARRMKQMKKLFPTQSFFCSKWADYELKRICNPTCVHMEDGTFDNRILFTTQVLDNGIDIKDKTVSHVFSELMDVDKLIQSLGRRRQLAEDDMVTFHIRRYSRNEISGKLKSAEKKIREADEFLRDRQQFFRENGRRTKLGQNRMFDWIMDNENGQGHFEVNRMMYQKTKRDILRYELMVETSHEAVVLKALGEETFAGKVSMSTVTVSSDIVKEVEQYLHSIENCRIYVDSEDMNELNRMFLKLGKLRYSKRPIGAYNGMLNDKFPKYPYRLHNKDSSGKYYKDKDRKMKDGSDNPYRDKGYWMFEPRPYVT